MNESTQPNADSFKEPDISHTDSVHSARHKEHHNLSPRLPKTKFDEDTEGQGLAIRIEENPKEFSEKVSFEEMKDLGDNSEMKAHTAFNEFSFPNMG